MVKSDFLLAVTQLAAERRLPREVVFNAIEAALVSAFKKDVVGGSQNISVKIRPTDGEIMVYIHKIVVESVVDSKNEISLEDARKVRPNAQLGETVELEETPKEAGRIAAQTAKQVVMQRLREAERDIVFEEYASRVNELLNGVVQKVEPGQVIINLGRTEAILPAAEQVPSERYRPGQRLRVLVLEVERGVKGPRIVVSRAHRDLIRRLFELEVPEIVNGAVVIRAIAREPGYRTKVAVEARQDGVDPVGACVGLRGVRIQNIVNELNGEKIDVIPWSADPAVFLAQALSPAQATRVEVRGEKSALVVVPDRHLSLAIGREGQNARLAARLTGWRIDIRSNSEVLAEEAERAARGPEQPALATAPAAEAPEAPVAKAPETVTAAGVQQGQQRQPEPLRPAASTATQQAPVAAPKQEAVAAPAAQQPTPTVEEEEDIEVALRALEEEEAAQRAAAEAEEEQPEEPEQETQRFDFDQWLQQFQSQNAGPIRFAEDIFPERGGRFKGNRDRGDDRGGRKGASGRKGGSR
jgi:N utilization substance protein A